MNNTYKVDLAVLIELNPQYSIKSLYDLFMASFWNNLDELETELKLERARIRVRPTNNQFNVVIENCSLKLTEKILVFLKSLINFTFDLPCLFLFIRT
ncbi:MAG: hypothetical protein WKF85_14070 [Chitinophagaceae bacterium]